MSSSSCSASAGVVPKLPNDDAPPNASESASRSTRYHRAPSDAPPKLDASKYATPSTTRSSTERPSPRSTSTLPFRPSPDTTPVALALMSPVTCTSKRADSASWVLLAARCNVSIETASLRSPPPPPPHAARTSRARAAMTKTMRRTDKNGRRAPRRYVFSTTHRRGACAPLRDSLEVAHAVHAAGHRGHRGLVLELVGHDRFGGEEEARDRRRVLQRGA